MNLDFSDDQKALQDQVRRFLAERCTSAAVRRIVESDETHDRDLYAGLAELGVLGAAIPEAYGGVGLSKLELCLFAEELGRVIAPVPVSSSIYLAAEFLLLAGSEAQKTTWLPKLAAGEIVGTFALTEGSGRTTPDKVKASVRNGRLTGTKVAVPDGAAADLAVVAARHGTGEGADGISLYLVDLRGPGVERTVLTTLDPSRKAATFTFKDAPADLLSG